MVGAGGWRWVHSFLIESARRDSCATLILGETGMYETGMYVEGPSPFSYWFSITAESGRDGLGTGIGNIYIF